MNTKFLKSATGLLFFACAIFFISAFAAVPPANAQGGKPANGKPPVLSEEDKAYAALYASRTGNPTTQVQLGEDFVKKFPDSHYLAGVYSQLTTAYMTSGQEDKMFTAGDKALELNPDNVDVLAVLAMAMPRRVKSNSLDAAQQYDKAEKYARHAIELIPTLAKPDGVDDATFQKAKDEKLSMAHSGLGLIDYQHQKYGEAVTELSQAVQLSANPDPVDYYLLGNANVQTSHFKDAIAAYDKCSATGPLTAQCKSKSDDAQKKAATQLSAQ